jgi:hypothetical protein
MMYFILWVVFLLTVILAVPIVSFVENRKRQAALGPRVKESEEELEADGESEAFEEEPGEATFEAVEETPLGGDDFSAFEEIR